MRQLTEYLRPDLIAAVDRLDLRARFIVEGFLAGLHASPYHGFSVEFSEHRKYVPGDDLRLIDWNVYGRTDRFYVKKYEAETSMDAYLLIDASPSMNFPQEGQIEPGGPARMTKIDYCITIAATLGHMMIHQQDSVGLFTFDERIRTALPAKSRPTHLTQMIAALANTTPAGRTNTSAALHEIAERVKKRSLMVLFSDLLTESAPLIDAMHHLRFRGHDLIVFCVLDHAEATFPYQGPTRFEGVESIDRITADALALRAGYLDELHKFLQAYRDATAALRADFVLVDNVKTFDQVLVPFLHRRQARF